VAVPSALLTELFGLAGQVAVVTGGMGRLGSRYAHVLAEAGASVAVFDLPHRTNSDVDQLAERFAVSTHQLDVTNRAAVDAAFREVGQRFGTATILINNAGLGASPSDQSLETGRFEQYPESAWEAMIASHLKSALIASQ
jgi:NAD(P)-dependent dehydrogenase (short-subunit alcohol dehydrogenase family)